ncbi:inactive peptidyl-prolyl cis-trans isomerase FKBP6 isoform X1 [Synchiropus splendidus]|uniref:inactive peptidyl-prolyl cis-trans isomerase FKBP6 isoform X1 n=1 Tax=Synchiropus splendidus TaxID=270530 RepID=UPI00237E9104|nr:inactive peptidyl-prolyl cis-trans isomerase FKBP6 isoform X1 [Synchiropus splendidus]
MPNNGETNVQGTQPTSAGAAASSFERLAHQMQDVLGDGGILKQVVQPGEGPLIPQKASVLMHYSAYLESSSRPFESNTYMKHPNIMKLGRDVTLAGLELGLLTMKKGEFSRFLFWPQYAYGEMGCPPLIPPASIILYEVEVLDFLDSDMDEFVSLSPVSTQTNLCQWSINYQVISPPVLSQEEQNSASLPTLIKVVDTLREFGNRRFRQRNFFNAKGCYKQATTLLANRETQSDAERKEIRASQLLLYLNLSLTELRLDSPQKALKHANNALEIDPSNTKALFRGGQAYAELGDYERAQDCLILAQARKPFDTNINNLLKTVAFWLKDSQDKERDMCRKMFKDLRGL